MTSSNAQAWNTKHILLNNLGAKQTQSGNFGKILSKKLYEKFDLETNSRPFLIFKDSSVKRNLSSSACRSGQILIVLLLHMQYK